MAVPSNQNLSCVRLHQASFQTDHFCTLHCNAGAWTHSIYLISALSVALWLTRAKILILAIPSSLSLNDGHLLLQLLFLFPYCLFQHSTICLPSAFLEILCKMVGILLFSWLSADWHRNDGVWRDNDTLFVLPESGKHGDNLASLDSICLELYIHLFPAKHSVNRTLTSSCIHTPLQTKPW